MVVKMMKRKDTIPYTIASMVLEGIIVGLFITTVLVWTAVFIGL